MWALRGGQGSFQTGVGAPLQDGKSWRGAGEEGAFQADVVTGPKAQRWVRAGLGQGTDKRGGRAVSWMAGTKRCQEARRDPEAATDPRPVAAPGGRGGGRTLKPRPKTTLPQAPPNPTGWLKIKATIISLNETST